MERELRKDSMWGSASKKAGPTKQRRNNMPLGILNNIPSLAAENELTLTSSALNSTLEQLSSGSRINTGADDPAGLAIANGLQANISALTQSVSNANDGVGELQLADGALAQVTNLLNTAVTLATESATGTVSNAQRTAIQAQYTSILAEINRIGTATTYNGQAVFQNGSVTNNNAADSITAGALNPNSALTVGGVTTVTAGGASFAYTAAAGVANPNVAISGGAALTAGEALVQTAGTLTVVHGGVTTTFATAITTPDTVQSLVNAINGTATAGITVTGSTTGLSAALVGGQLQITDTAGNNNLAVSGEAGILTGATTFADSTAPTVQNLINAINNDTTVGAKAVLTGGNLVITDPTDRNDLTVTTTDTVLGAAVAGTASQFATPVTTGVATPNVNQLVGSTAGLTDATAVANGSYAFTAGGKTFTYTAAGGTGNIGALINSLTGQGLTSSLNTAGDLVITDPNNSGNLAEGTGTAALLATSAGTLANPSATNLSTPTNIFLSDATSIGSSQISVQIGSLTTAGITNGNGGNAVNLNAAGADLSTQSDAQATITLIDAAIANVASVRGTLGASVNRLTAASNVINSQVQNLTSAENTITAADIPTVVANLTKYSILEQTGISALAQANQQQQLVLKLLQ
jgi:flagellin